MKALWFFDFYSHDIILLLRRFFDADTERIRYQYQMQ